MAKGGGGEGNFAGTGGYGGQFPGFGGAGAGYTGGYGNPSSVGGGTAGQTTASQAYANTLNKYNPLKSNYSGNYVGGTGTLTAAQKAKTKSTATKAPSTTGLEPKWYVGLSDEEIPIPTAKPVTPLNVQSGAFFPGASAGVSPPTPVNVQSGAAFPGESIHSGYTSPGSWNMGSHPTTNTGLSTSGPGSGWGGIGTAIGDAVSGFGNMVTGGNRRQFGGPVAPGGQYTVGENGPETLQMGQQGGQVIPNNPVDRLGGMNPGMMQALLQLMQQRRPQMNPGQAPVGQPAPQMPRPQPPMGQGPGGMGGPGGPGGSFQLGDWRNRMGIEGLSRPPRPNMGFGGSGLGIPGVLPHMANRGMG